MLVNKSICWLHFCRHNVLVKLFLALIHKVLFFQDVTIGNNSYTDLNWAHYYCNKILLYILFWIHDTY